MLILLAGGLNVASAQPGGFDPAAMRERMVAQIDETVTALALDEARAPKVKEILMTAVNKRFELMAQRGGGAPGGPGMREAMTQINQETEVQLAEVLTADELAKYKKIEAERRPRGGRPGGGPRGN